MPHSGEDTFRALPLGARAYIAALTALAVALPAVAGPLGWSRPLDLALLVILLAVCAGGNLFAIYAPGHYALQPNYGFFIWGALLLPPWAIVLLAIGCFTPAFVMRESARYKLVFNVVNYALTGFVAAAVVQLAGTFAHGTSFDAVGVGGLVVAAALAAAANHAMVIAVVALSGEGSSREGVRQLIEGAPLSAGLGLTGGVFAALWYVWPPLAITAVGPMGLVYHALWVPMLRHKAQTDSKTGLYNFEYLMDAFESLLATAKRRDEELVVVMVDLDHLRLINSRCGHLAGDRVIRGMAEALADGAGARGVAARFGGEEYCLLLPGTSLEDGHRLIDALRERVGRIEFRESATDPELRVTFSAGIAIFPDHGATVSGLLDAADAAVYRAKAQGRNRVELATASVERARVAVSAPAA